MVDALRRARRWLKPDGVLIDLRPTSDLLIGVEVGAADGWTQAGLLTVEDARRARYAAADLSMVTALDRGWFALEHERRLDFLRYADSPDEMRDYIAGNWRQTSLGPETHARAVALHSRRPASRVRLVERLVMRSLRPAA